LQAIWKRDLRQFWTADFIPESAIWSLLLIICFIYLSTPSIASPDQQLFIESDIYANSPRRPLSPRNLQS